MPANKDRVQLLVDALRSGKYIQGHGTMEALLGEKGRQHCCLGVAVRVAMENGVKVAAVQHVNPDGVGCVSFDEASGYLPLKVADWYGFSGERKGENCTNVSLVTAGVQTTATALNDTLNYTFDQIATAFEETYINA